MIREINFVPEQGKYLFTITFKHDGKRWMAADYVSVKQYKAAKDPLIEEFLWKGLEDACINRLALERGDHYIAAGI